MSLFSHEINISWLKIKINHNLGSSPVRALISLLPVSLCSSSTNLSPFHLLLLDLDWQHARLHRRAELLLPVFLFCSSTSVSPFHRLLIDLDWQHGRLHRTQDYIGEWSIRGEHSSGEQTTNRRASHIFNYPEGPLFLERKLFDRFISIRSPINQFKQTHFSRKGAWGAGAEEKYNLMLKTKEQATQQETPLDEKQIVEDVLGSRSGYIKGQGLAQPAVPKRPRGASSSSSSIQNMIDQVREEHRREIEKLKEENSRQLEEMRREMIQMMQGLRDP
ncbi:hypothetical protein H6P81_002555 [Aristolochia fimbriata]|uniref:Uncharacterized protein n=1 Tax=Aristolochia fimbriata TaxID=158543 RepID=A0AAV7FA31_ARIFI|nr:hypothetical protein H6P81_002555 [Aristolochia fimbriata]